MPETDVLRVTDPAAARALRAHSVLLGLFLEPRSPSEVAPKMDMAANLVHHHAKKLAELGLLREQRREGGRVYYQLTAGEFRVPSHLLPPDEEQGNGTADLRDLSAGFLRAYDRSWATMGEADEDTYRFAPAAGGPVPVPPPVLPSPESHPTHLHQLSLRLSPARYRQLGLALSALLHEAAHEGQDASGKTCTFAVLAFQDDEMLPAGGVAEGLNSFLGPEMGVAPGTPGR